MEVTYTVSKVARGKFGCGYAGRNTTMYGAGSYFATTTAYTVGYAAPNFQSTMKVCTITQA